LSDYNIVGEAKFAERELRVFDLVAGQAFIRSNLNRDSKGQAFAGRKLGQDFGVEVHPFLRRNFAVPYKTDHFAGGGLTARSCYVGRADAVVAAWGECVTCTLAMRLFSAFAAGYDRF
jgi:hypothetical protein